MQKVWLQRYDFGASSSGEFTSTMMKEHILQWIRPDNPMMI
jgi:hypothetical protein